LVRLFQISTPGLLDEHGNTPAGSIFDQFSAKARRSTQADGIQLFLFQHGDAILIGPRAVLGGIGIEAAWKVGGTVSHRDYLGFGHVRQCADVLLTKPEADHADAYFVHAEASP
jgi:hypothetical protein